MSRRQRANAWQLECANCGIAIVRWRYCYDCWRMVGKTVLTIGTALFTEWLRRMIWS